MVNNNPYGDVMARAETTLAFETSTRRDVRWWGLFFVGLIFWIVANQIDPAANCDEHGECAPWLVPFAGAMGVLALCGGAAMLIANPHRGIRVDPATGRLFWWQGRRGSGPPAEAGDIAIADIARIRVVNTSDSDHIYFYGGDGALLPLPESEVFPWPYQDWAQQLTDAYPHIDLVVVNG